MANEVEMIRIETGDFRQLSDELVDASVDLVLTDPPYPREYLPLWGDLARVAARVLRPGGFLVAYSGQMYLPEIIGMLGKHLDWYWLGGLRHGGKNGMIWPRRLRNAVKPILVYAKRPVRKQPKCFVDLVDSAAPCKDFHVWGQNSGPVIYLAETFSNPGNLVLDPFLGGGTTALACLQTGRSCIGYEINPATADIARARLASAQLPLPLPVVTQEAMVLAI